MDSFRSDCSLYERQEFELQALQAIYMDDVTDLRQSGGEILEPPDMRIRLLPQESNNVAEAHAGVALMVKFTRSYPEEVPVIKLDEVKGLSNQQVAQLKQELDRLAKKMIGQEMVLALCQHVQTFLHANNKPPSKSFYDEMLLNRQRQEQKEAKANKKRLELQRQKEQKEVQQIEEEIKRKEDALKEDFKRRRELARQEEQNQARWSRSCSPSDRLKRRKSSSLSNAEQTNDSEENNSQCIENTYVMQFHGNQDIHVYKGKSMGQSAHRSTQVYLGLDIESGEIVTITEWNLHSAANSSGQGDMVHSAFSSVNFNHQVSAIEYELMSLLGINHTNLVHYLGIHYVVQPTDLKIAVLTEYVGGGSLLMWINKSLIVPLDLLRHYTLEILSGLQYLHSKDVIHGDLRLTSLHLDSLGHLRIADYSIHKRIVDLVSTSEASDRKVQATVRTASGEPPSKKKDIHNMGLVLLALIQGSVTTDVIPDIPHNLPPELVDFLQRCIHNTNGTNWNVHQLSEHAFVKTAVRTNLVIAVQKHGTQHGAKGLVTSEEEHSDAVGEDNRELSCIPFTSGCVSRVNNEFQVLCEIGRGAFGDVVKVRNKLDGRCYAIKRIPLNPSKKQLTKKITREVKLLSRLNHENVVRYFNSWIETTEQIDSSRSASTLSPSKSPHSRAVSEHVANSRRINLSAVLKHTVVTEKVVSGSPMSNAGDNDSVNWDSPSEKNNKDSETDEDSSDELEDHGVFDSFRLFGDDEDSDDESIQFLREGDEDQHSDSSSTEETDNSSLGSVSFRNRHSQKSPHKLQCLYIQMEFCEKSTLRDCIDSALYKDVSRVWQLFREIIEGLVHIHDQGMIHRDLKPVNIFLDSNDHVKIGDFGLATTDIIAASETGMLDINAPDISNKLDSGRDDGSLTGRVGTALYVSPEMMNSTTRYNQKVDLYSLGVIFFEMCYRPMATGMERIKTLTNLRNQSIEFPDDFNELEMENQAKVLRWLLSHNPSKRPTSKELLKSPYLPPPHMEESELHEVLRSTIAVPDSTAYKHMINTIFSQSLPLPKKDFAYDSSLYKIAASLTSDEIIDNALIHRSVVDMLQGIFHRHGAVCISTPLLMPKSLLHETNETYVCLMDHSGGLVGLPHDSKVPFARYIARTGVTQLKRFSIENVYRENRLQGLHPRELAACSFDIVHPSSCSSLIPDAEVIAIVSEIISEMEAHDCRNYKIRINHTALVKAVFLHCGIAEALHSEVYAILGNSKMERQQKLQIRTRLCSLSLSEQSVDQLCNFIFHEGDFRKQASYLRCITKSVGEACSLAKKGLRELEDIFSYVECLGCKFQHVLALGLLANIQHYSGIIFQIVCEVKRKSGTSLDVLAAGGRYDALIAHFLKPGASSTQPVQKVVGVSIAFDKISNACKKPDTNQLPAVTDALIWSLGHRSMAKEQLILQIAKDLWSIGVSANIHLTADDSLEDVKDHCRSNRIGHLIVQKDSEVSLYKVQTSEKDRVIKCCKSHLELIEYFQSRARVSESSDAQPNVALKSQSSSSIINSIESSGNIYTTAGSTSSGSLGGSGNAVLPNFNISYVFPESNKLAKNAKRQYESQILSTVTTVLPQFSNRCRIEIVAVDLNMSIIKSLAAHLDLSRDEDIFSSSVGAVVKEFPRYKKYLIKITDEIQDLKYENNKHVAVVILYSLSDEAYRVLL